MGSPRHVKQLTGSVTGVAHQSVMETANRTPRGPNWKIQAQAAERTTAAHVPAKIDMATNAALENGAAAEAVPAASGAQAEAKSGGIAADTTPAKGTPKKRGRKAAESTARGAEATTAPEADGAPADATPAERTPKKRGKKAAESAAAKGAEVVAAPDASGAAADLTPAKREPKKRGKKAAEPTASSVEASAPSHADGAAGDAADADAQPAKKKRAAKKPAWPPGPLYEASMRPPKHEGPTFRIISWNVAGLRGLAKRQPGALKRLAEAEEADVICLQETKLQDKHVENAQQEVGLPGWSFAWNCSTVVKGYAGTAIISRAPPLQVTHGLNISDHDQEGRVITAEYDAFFVVNVYTPNSGDGLRRLEYRTDRWDVDFAAYVTRLRQQKPVIVTGDLNCAHMEIDIHEPKRNLRSAGFTEEERQSFSKCYIEAGMLDAFRRQHPGIVGYTYYSFRFNMREKGKGWRLDYALVSRELEDQLHDCYHLTDVFGSDHVPVGLVLKLPQSAKQ